MWVSKELFEELRTQHKTTFESLITARLECANLQGENTALKQSLAKTETLNEWFRHRLTQVEQERAQLIYAATGGKEPIPREVKIPTPNFNGQVPVENFATMAQMLNKGFNPFEGIGEDSQDPSEQIPGAAVEDTSNMPQRR